ncbi:MAG: bacteriocin-protection protein [Eudoraea sp.]|nr:bacteriocin-protection protein [Eudoraea sp.]
MTPIFFKDQKEFRAWLRVNHSQEQELWVGYYKVKTGKPSLTWSESVDQALCFGWIDGLRRSLGTESYCIRFTPRRKNSNWSAVNIKKVKELRASGLMKEAGLKAYKLQKEKKSRVYSYDKTATDLSADLKKLFQKNKKAWAFFEEQAPSYKRKMIHWILSAKKRETRETRLKKTIDASEHHTRLY